MTIADAWPTTTISDGSDALRGLIESISDGFAILDRDFVIRDINAAGLALETRPREALIGRSHWEAYPGSYESEIGSLYRKAVGENVGVQLDHRYVWEDGRVSWFEMRAQPIPHGLAIVYRDITGRRQREIARDALIALDDRIRDLEDTAEISYAAAETLGRALQVSRAGYGTIDKSSETIVIERDWNAPGIRSLAGTLHFRDYGSYIEDLKAGRTVAIADAEKDPRTTGNADALKAISAQAVLNMPLTEQGGLVALLYLNHATPRVWTEDELHLIRDIAERTRTAVERRRVEGVLRVSEARFEAIVDSIDQMIWSTRPDGFHDYYNQRWYDYTGVPQGSTDGEGWNGMFHPEDQDRAWGAWRWSLASGEPYHIEYRLRHRSGVYRWVLGRAQCVRDASGSIVRWYGTCTDIQEIVEAREVLAQARDELDREVVVKTAERQLLWQHAQDMQVIIDGEGIFLDVNPAVTRILGWAAEELVGHPFFDFVVEADTTPSEGALAHARDAALPVFENRYRHKDGGVRYISWVAAPYGDRIFASGRDVTAEREQAQALAQTQAALRQSQKMEAVGQLTGGIAHDFNNMLAVVIGSLDLLSRRIDVSDARAKRYVESASEGARRAALLTQRLLAFSRQQPLRPETIDANRLVSGMSDLLRRSLGTAIRLETVLAGGLWVTNVDPNQLENAILNLAVNARDAMPDGGRLTIETQNAHLDDRYTAAEIGVAAGQYVLVAVTDTGGGMSEAVIAKAFDPFFTTKAVGKGTGLGLSQVYGFVKQTGGHVKIYSEPDHGTTIKIYLPRLHEVPAVEDVVPEATSLPLGDPFEVVLVVEDEPAVRELSVEALTTLGYRVLEADGAAAALRILETHPQIHLVFTDVVMPDVNGAKLAEEIRRRHPGMRILFTTGYTRNAVVHNGVLDKGVELISKPFTIEELANKVRAMLDAPTRS